MQESGLDQAARALVAPGKGILAADNNADVIFPGFDILGIERTDDKLQAYWAMLFSVEGLSEFVSGVILSEDAIALDRTIGKSFVSGLVKKGIAVGVGLDRENVVLPTCEEEETAGGLETLKDRLAMHGDYGATFAKWCMPIRITADLPSDFGYQANALQLARYAALCQSHGIVPIVEFDIMTDGSHSIGRCAEVTSRMLQAVFPALQAQGVDLKAIILKPNMVTPGRETTSASSSEIASATLAVLRRHVPAETAGVAFLSGGQTPAEVTHNLDTINRLAGDAPWPMTFCFGRTFQQPALEAWKGEHCLDGQKAVLHRAKMSSLARRGMYDATLEG